MRVLGSTASRRNLSSREPYLRQSNIFDATISMTSRRGGGKVLIDGWNDDGIPFGETERRRDEGAFGMSVCLLESASRDAWMRVAREPGGPSTAQKWI